MFTQVEKVVVNFKNNETKTKNLGNPTTTTTSQQPDRQYCINKR
jgi:hypothetical protein